MIFNISAGYSASRDLPAFTFVSPDANHTVYADFDPKRSDPSQNIWDDTKITKTQDATTGDWLIKFLVSGIFTITRLSSADRGVDIFVVGGGGAGTSYAGGGGGYVKTVKRVHLRLGNPYTITIGAGGNAPSAWNGAGSPGGQTAFGNVAVAEGGEGAPSPSHGGNGGSGGAGLGSSAITNRNKTGGQNGSKGLTSNANPNSAAPGEGSGEPTRAFGDPDGDLYSPGGGGSTSDGTNPTKGGFIGNADNTGAGANGWSSGRSGIAMMRNSRAATNKNLLAESRYPDTTPFYFQKGISSGNKWSASSTKGTVLIPANPNWQYKITKIAAGNSIPFKIAHSHGIMDTISLDSNPMVTNSKGIGFPGVPPVTSVYSYEPQLFNPYTFSESAAQNTEYVYETGDFAEYLVIELNQSSFSSNLEAFKIESVGPKPASS